GFCATAAAEVRASASAAHTAARPNAIGLRINLISTPTRSAFKTIRPTTPDRSSGTGERRWAAAVLVCLPLGQGQMQMLREDHGDAAIFLDPLTDPPARGGGAASARGSDFLVKDTDY